MKRTAPGNSVFIRTFGSTVGALLLAALLVTTVTLQGQTPSGFGADGGPEAADKDDPDRGVFGLPSIPGDAEACFEIVDYLNGMIREADCPLKQNKTIKPQKNVATPVETETAFKSSGELNRYLECYANNGDDKIFDKVRAKFMPAIEEAAKAFSIPKTLLACLIFKESRFDLHAVSSTGAFGLSQYVDGAMKHMSNILSNIKDDKAETVEKMQNLVSQTAAENAKENKTSIRQARDDMKFAQSKIADRELRLQWEQYYANLKSRGIYRGPVARKIDRATLTDYKVGIGSAALYLKYIIMQLKENLDPDIRLNHGDGNVPNFEILLTSAGAYNIGPGAAVKILSAVEPPNRDDWVKALAKSNEETAKHILSIRNCIESSASGKGNAWAPPIPDHPRMCNSQDEPGKIVGKRTDLPEEFRNDRYKTAASKAFERSKENVVKAPTKSSRPEVVASTTSRNSTVKISAKKIEGANANEPVGKQGKKKKKKKADPNDLRVAKDRKDPDES